MDVEQAHAFDPDENDPLEFDLRPKKENRDQMIDCALRIMPALEKAELVGHLAGVRPMSPDRMPIIGPAGAEGVYLAAGHGTKGIHLAPITGQIVADLVLRGQTEAPVPTEAFLPERFAF